MRSRNLVILALVTVVVIVAAAVVSHLRAPTKDIKTTLLFPQLEKQINNVSEIVVRDRDGSVNMVKQKDGWVVSQVDNYPALFAKIKPLLINMAQLRVLEPKTSTPSLYPRLGVEDIDSKGATSHLLTLKDAGGKTLAELIVGKRQQGGAPGSPPGVYVRQPGKAQSLLVRGELPVSSRASDWFRKDLLNVVPDRIASIEIRRPDGSTATLERGKGQDKFKLASVPRGREAQSDVILYRMGNILQDIYAEDVKSQKHFALPDDHVTTTVRTFDGLVATIAAAKVDGTNHVQYSFSVDAAKLPAKKPDDAGKDKDKKDAAATQESGEKLDVRKEAAGYNKETAGWVYTLPPFQYELLVQSLDQLTRPAGKSGDKSRS